MLRSSIGYVADALIIVVAVVFLWTQYSQHQARQQASALGPRVGSSIGEIGLRWTGTGANLVLLLSNKCHFCSESAPFYRRLIDSLGDRGYIAAIFPHDTEAGVAFLNQLGLKVSVVRGNVFLPWPVRTPTVLLCDSRGTIVNVWPGKLSPAQETQVTMAAVGANALSTKP